MNLKEGNMENITKIPNHKIREFQLIVKEIHRANRGWHCFEASNRFLNLNNMYLQSHYLKKKNILQDQLVQEYSVFIEIMPIDFTGHPSIKIKEKYQFNNYNDACHIQKEKEIDNV